MKTNKFFLSFFIFFILSVSVIAVPKYNLGSMQTNKNAKISSEQDFIKLYFYNIYGNLPTEINLKVDEKPEGWDVQMCPNHLIIDVGEALEEKPDVIPEGIEYISSKIGFLPCQVSEIRIKPHNPDLDKSYELLIKANAVWKDQVGMVKLQQSRSFKYSLTVGDVPKKIFGECEGYVEEEKQPEPEEIIEEEIIEEQEKVKVTGMVVEKPSTIIISPEFLIIGLFVVLVIIIWVVVIWLLLRRRKKKK